MEWSSGGSTRISDCAKLTLSKVRVSEGVDDSANFSVNFNLLKEERIYHVELKSRMNREVHVRFCERFGGETPPYLLVYFKTPLLTN